jgi:hypothetical protein
MEALLAVVAGAGDERALEAGLAQDLDRLGNGDQLPRVVAIVEMRVENGLAKNRT